MGRMTRSLTAALLAAFLVAGCNLEDQIKPSADTTAPSTPTNVLAAAHGSHQIDLTWTPSTDNVGVAGYEIRSGGAAVGTATTNAFSVSSLNAATHYCYVVMARDAAGNVSATSAEVCATTLEADTTPPSTPANLTATGGATAIVLTWTASTDNVAVAGYDVYRDGTKITTVTGITHTDGNLGAGSAHCYTVRAVDADGNVSGHSPEACGTTTPQENAYTATGTYLYDSGAGTLVLNTITSDFPCDGPSVGTETMQVGPVTETTLVLGTGGGDDITFTRPSGTAGDITGTWHATDPGGTSYDLTISANNTFTIVGHRTRSCFAEARSQHWPGAYQVSLSFRDENHEAQSVTVRGPGLPGAVSLCYAEGRWNNWTFPCDTRPEWTTPPALPLTYVFTMTRSGGATQSETAVVDCFIEELPTDLLPNGVYSGPLHFLWTPTGQSGIRYQVQLNDANYNRVWESDYVVDTGFVAYTGPALAAGMYHWYVVAETNQGSCDGFGQASFDYTP